MFKNKIYQLFATTAILEAVLLEQLQPWISTLSFDVSLDGSSKPTILVLLPTLIFWSFFPFLTVSVFESASKLTTPFMA